jgi:hypothetical protein
MTVLRVLRSMIRSRRIAFPILLMVISHGNTRVKGNGCTAATLNINF